MELIKDFCILFVSAAVKKNVVYGGFCFVLRALDITQKSHNVRNLLVLRHAHIVL